MHTAPQAPRQYVMKKYDILQKGVFPELNFIEISFYFEKKWICRQVPDFWQQLNQKDVLL